MAGPATDNAVAIELLPSARQPVPIEGYMKSCVGGASGPKPGAVAGAGVVPGGAGGPAGGAGAAAGAALGGVGAS